MRYLRTLFVINLILALIAVPLLPMMLLVSVGSQARLCLFAAVIIYVITSFWLLIWGKRNRRTAVVGACMVTALVAAAATVHFSDAARMKEECNYFKTLCAKLKDSGVYHCGGADGYITIGAIPEHCMPTKEASCTYAAQYCKKISPTDSTYTVYKCSDNDTITCP